MSNNSVTSLELGLAWAVHGAAAIILVGMLIALSRDRYRRNLVFRFSQATQLPLLTETIIAAAERRILHRTAAMMAGGLLGLLASAGVLWLNPADASAFTIWLVTLPLTLTGMCAGSAFVALRESLFRHPTDALRVARPTIVTLRDYLSPRRLLTPVALLLTAVLVCLTAAVLALVGLIDGAVFLRSAALPMLALALLVVASGGLLARRVLRQPQPATSALELAWDDAFRADTFRALWMFGSIVAWLTVAVAGLGALQGLDALAGTSWSLGLGSQLFTWGFLAVLLGFTIRSAQSYFRFRLWMDLSLGDPEEVGTP